MVFGETESLIGTFQILLCRDNVLLAQELQVRVVVRFEELIKAYIPLSFIFATGLIFSKLLHSIVES